MSGLERAAAPSAGGGRLAADARVLLCEPTAPGDLGPADDVGALAGFVVGEFVAATCWPQVWRRLAPHHARAAAACGAARRPFGAVVEASGLVAQGRPETVEEAVAAVAVAVGVRDFEISWFCSDGLGIAPVTLAALDRLEVRLRRRALAENETERTRSRLLAGTAPLREDVAALLGESS